MGLMLLLVAACSPSPKLGHLDVDRLLAGHGPALAARTEIAKALEPLQGRMEDLTASIRTTEARVAARRPHPGRGRDDAEGELREARLERARAAAEIGKLEAQLVERHLGPVMARLREHLQAFAHQSGHDLIVSSSDAVPLSYAAPSLDVTDDFLAYLARHGDAPAQAR